MAFFQITSPRTARGLKDRILLMGSHLFSIARYTALAVVSMHVVACSSDRREGTSDDGASTVDSSEARGAPIIDADLLVAGDWYISSYRSTMGEDAAIPLGANWNVEFKSNPDGILRMSIEFSCSSLGGPFSLSDVVLSPAGDLGIGSGACTEDPFGVTSQETRILLLMDRSDALILSAESKTDIRLSSSRNESFVITDLTRLDDSIR